MNGRTQDDALDIHFIGNATVLLSQGPLTLLTDPNFLHRGQYAYLGPGLLSRRLTESLRSTGTTSRASTASSCRTCTGTAGTAAPAGTSTTRCRS
ncbi:hypothetical protein [Streptomyces sp. NPDC058741]|uniref:hypothetical protein n=1 Tax=Streptomyces sp. NPDC058741 TaxID=3346620 RepID=UPI0036C85334